LALAELEARAAERIKTLLRLIEAAPDGKRALEMTAGADSGEGEIAPGAKDARAGSARAARNVLRTSGP
jgi:hypothetical protein